jgi:hypothetical protein
MSEDDDRRGEFLRQRELQTQLWLAVLYRCIGRGGMFARRLVLRELQTSDRPDSGLSLNDPVPNAG